MILYSLGKINIFRPDYSIFACALICRLCCILISVCVDLFSACGGFARFQDENQQQDILFFILFSFSTQILCSLRQVE